MDSSNHEVPLCHMHPFDLDMLNVAHHRSLELRLVQNLSDVDAFQNVFFVATFLNGMKHHKDQMNQMSQMSQMNQMNQTNWMNSMNPKNSTS